MRKWMNELQDGDRLWMVVLLNDVSRGVTNKGAPYLNFVIQDKTGTMEAKYWNVKEDELHLYKAGMYVRIKGDIINYKDQLQMRVLEVHDDSDQDHDVREFVRSAAIDKQEMKQRILSYLSMIEDEDIKRICEAIHSEQEHRFYDYPAAAKNHHDFAGGLATHVLGMMDLAKHICSLYPLLNQDLLIAGVFLHDIGKLVELSGPIATEYTIEGKLLGHISIMQAMVAETAARLQIQSETVVLLRHMVLSHHGEHEYGSPVLPMIPEAEVLNLIDNLDARMNTLEKALDRVRPGEFTSRIFALENRMFYKIKK